MNILLIQIKILQGRMAHQSYHYPCKGCWGSQTQQNWFQDPRLVYIDYLGSFNVIMYISGGPESNQMLFFTSSHPRKDLNRQFQHKSCRSRSGLHLIIICSSDKLDGRYRIHFILSYEWYCLYEAKMQSKKVKYVVVQQEEGQEDKETQHLHSTI
jgi:hypothetical protein